MGPTPSSFSRYSIGFVTCVSSEPKTRHLGGKHETSYFILMKTWWIRMKMSGLLLVLLLAWPTVHPHHGEKLLLVSLDAVEILEVHQEDKVRGVGQQFSVVPASNIQCIGILDLFSFVNSTDFSGDFLLRDDPLPWLIIAVTLAN